MLCLNRSSATSILHLAHLFPGASSSLQTQFLLFFSLEVFWTCFFFFLLPNLASLRNRITSGPQFHAWLLGASPDYSHRKPQHRILIIEKKKKKEEETEAFVGEDE